VTAPARTAHEPPALAESLLTRCLPSDERAACILGDLRQEFADLCRLGLERPARGWYRKQALAIGWRYLLARHRPATMLGSNQPVGPNKRGNTVESLLQDTRYAVRSFARRPGFSLTVIAIVGLGIGAATSIFSVVDGVLLKRLPYPDPHELVFFGNPAHPIPLMLDWRDRTNSFASMAGVWDREVDLTGDGEPQTIRIGLVTRDFFSLLGARAGRGRLFASDEFESPSRVAVVSYLMWQSRWGGDRDLIGKTVTLGGEPATVVGVLDSEFQDPDAMVGSGIDVWLPLDLRDPEVANRNMYILAVGARLKTGVTREAAQADVNALTAILAEEHPDHALRRDGTPRRYTVLSLQEAIVGDAATVLYMLLGAVALLLVIACANVANLFLARGTERQREMALRGALGAGRTRVLGQLLTESVMISLAGGLLGLAIAYGGVRLFELYNPGGIPRAESIAVDLRVLGFALGVSALTGILFGLAPALQAMGVDVTDSLKDASGTLTASRARRKLRNTLVVAEIAVALVLLIGAGLLFNSFIRLKSIDPGFQTDDVVSVSLRFRPAPLDQPPEAERIRMTQDLLQRLAAIPGVERVAAGVTIPFGTGGRGTMCCWLSNVRATPEEIEDAPDPIIHPVTPGYFATIGTRVIRGREFTASDLDSASVPLIINTRLANRLFEAEDPIGRTIWFREYRGNVIGVVDNILHWGLHRTADYEMYVPYNVMGGFFGRIQFAVKSGLDPSVIAGDIREAVWAVNPDQPIREIAPVNQLVGGSIAEPRFVSALLIAFSAMAILLAAGGIYGSILYSVQQRQRELGIRMALGAGRVSVVGLILKQGMLLTAIGVTLGVGGALALTRTMESLLFGITPSDATTYVVVCALLAAVALTASYLPARRASETDPMETLRVE
jgi:putative ABC transport system permease protein